MISVRFIKFLTTSATMRIGDVSLVQNSIPNVRLTSPILTMLRVSFFGFQENAFFRTESAETYHPKRPQNTPRPRKGPLFGQMGGKH